MARSRVFLDVNIGAEPAGRLTIELFTDKTPKTCENFRKLCTNSDPSLSYAKSPFHRIIDEFMIQGGDITEGDGTGGKSIYNHGGEFEDENLGWRDLDAAGLVCMANRGKDTNSSQFFVTLEPCPHLNGKHTVFGHLVAGQDVLQKMAKVKVDDNDKPYDPVLVAKCGELERRKKPEVSQKLSPDTDASRGRQRDGSDPQPAARETDRPSEMTEKRKRRQSDNHVDENLRGRPRARSQSGSPASSAIQSDHDSTSPRAIHERRRSPSPSRPVAKPKGEVRDKEQDDDYERRRRRSLPNQYQDNSRKSGRDSERRTKRDDRQRSRSGSRDNRQRSRSRDNRQRSRSRDNRQRSRSRDNRRDERRNGPKDWDDPRGQISRDERRDDRRGGGYDRRPKGQWDKYRPNRNGQMNDGRLGDDGRLGGGAGGEDDGGIKFKGRGSMKYREPDRRW